MQKNSVHIYCSMPHVMRALSLWVEDLSVDTFCPFGLRDASLVSPPGCVVRTCCNYNNKFYSCVLNRNTNSNIKQFEG